MNKDNFSFTYTCIEKYKFNFWKMVTDTGLIFSTYTNI